MANPNNTTGALAEAYAKLDPTEKAFADIIATLMDNIQEGYRNMAEAGLVLLSAATNAVAIEPLDAEAQAAVADMDSVELLGAHIHQIAFEQGKKEGYEKGLREGVRMGVEKCLHDLDQILSERKGEPPAE